jgi:hypothetical protein
MRFCADHWASLRAAIDERGLDHLISDGGPELMRRTVDQLKGDDSLNSFDPLMAAHNMILSNVINAAGLVIFTPNPDGSERCPLCYLNQNCNCPEENCADKWVDFAADGVKKYYDEARDKEFPETID